MSSSLVCPKCAAIDSTEEDEFNNQVCFKCGYTFVNESALITDQVEFAYVGERILPQGRDVTSGAPKIHTALPPGVARPFCAREVVRDKNSLFVQAERLASVLQLGAAFIEKLNLHIGSIIKNGHYCRNVELLAAAIVYVLLRLEERPFTLLMISEKTQFSVYDLGKVANRVVQFNHYQLKEVSPEPFIEKVISELPLKDKSPLFKTEFCKDTCSLIQIAKQDWLSQGRKIGAIIAACAFLLFLQKGVLDTKGKKIGIDAICHVLGVAPHTVRARIKEIKTNLVQLAATLPWRTNVTLKTIHASIPFLIKHSQTLRTIRVADPDDVGEYTQGDQKSSRPTPEKSLPPPSFCRGLEQTKARHEKILRAKRRIFSPSDENLPIDDTMSLDKEDMIIERCLREGVNEQLLVNGYYEAAYAATISLDDIEVNAPLGDADIPDDELHLYVRSVPDAAVYEAARGPIEMPAKKRRRKEQEDGPTKWTGSEVLPSIPVVDEAAVRAAFASIEEPDEYDGPSAFSEQVRPTLVPLSENDAPGPSKPQGDKLPLEVIPGGVAEGIPSV